MDFDGAMRKEGVGEGIWVRYPKNDPKLLLINCILIAK